MKKLLFLLMIITAFTSASYASFPIIADTLETTIDTLQTEEIKQYHSSLIKMGIDLSACKCESCRNGITPLTKNGKEVLEKNKMNISENFIKEKINERLQAKKDGNYDLADAIRKDLYDKGVSIEDNKDITSWKYK